MTKLFFRAKPGCVRKNSTCTYWQRQKIRLKQRDVIILLTFPVRSSLKKCYSVIQLCPNETARLFPPLVKFKWSAFAAAFRLSCPFKQSHRRGHWRKHCPYVMNCLLQVSILLKNYWFKDSDRKFRRILVSQQSTHRLMTRHNDSP